MNAVYTLIEGEILHDLNGQEGNAINVRDFKPIQAYCQHMVAHEDDMDWTDYLNAMDEAEILAVAND